MSTVLMWPTARHAAGRVWRPRLTGVLREWRRRHRGRRELARLDARLLADIGLSHAEAWREINKPFWRE